MWLLHINLMFAHTDSCNCTWNPCCCESKGKEQIKCLREGESERRDHTTFFQKWLQSVLLVFLFWKHQSQIFAARILFFPYVLPYSLLNYKVFPKSTLLRIHQEAFLILRSVREKYLCFLFNYVSKANNLSGWKKMLFLSKEKWGFTRTDGTRTAGNTQAMHRFQN